MSDVHTAGSDLPETDLRELARALSAVLRQLHVLAGNPVGETLADRLAAHLGVDPKALPVLSHGGLAVHTAQHFGVRRRFPGSGLSSADEPAPFAPDE
jgi:hypothetical protein